MAIVGLGVRVAELTSAEELGDALTRGRGGRRAEAVELPLAQLRTPPSDLRAALAQQTLLLAAALDAAPPEVDPQRTGAFVGMQCDAEIARYGVRWRLPPHVDDGVRDAFAPVLKAAGVLGTMPNIPANRLNAQLDLRGPSHTVSADELSGVRALQIAARALRAGELDTAFVGAVELGCEPVHEAAARAVLPPARRRGGDAAVVLVLERLADARRAGRTVLACVEAAEAGGEPSAVDRGAGEPLRIGIDDVARRFGHAHAASGLLCVAFAALCLQRRARPGEPEGGWDAEGPRRALAEVDALGGQRERVVLVEPPSAARVAVAPSGAGGQDADRPPGGRPAARGGAREELSLVLPAHPPPVPDAEVVARALAAPSSVGAAACESVNADAPLAAEGAPMARAPRLPVAQGGPIVARSAPPAGALAPAPSLGVRPSAEAWPAHAPFVAAPSAGSAAGAGPLPVPLPPGAGAAAEPSVAGVGAPLAPAPAPPEPARRGGASEEALPPGPKSDAGRSASAANLPGGEASSAAKLAAAASSAANLAGAAASSAANLAWAAAPSAENLVGAAAPSAGDVAGAAASPAAAASRLASVGEPARQRAPADRSAAWIQLADTVSQTSRLHDDFLRVQTELHQRFLEGRARALAALLAATSEATSGAAARPRSAGADPATSSRVAPTMSPAPAASTNPEAGARRAPESTPDAARTALRGAAPKGSGGLAPHTPPAPPRGRRLSREELEVHASGRISDIFGTAFAEQDHHAVQVRMPEPPLLLADRATGLVGEPTSMGQGTVWTETDVTADAWYLVNGRMPAGLMIESGQADLLLISWLGADLLNRGARAYRLLGCQLTWHRSPPRVGETLRYDIHVDGHAKQGDVRLFFFHYDCHVGDEPALTVRGGQAGFFTEQELAASAGVIWEPAEQTIRSDARLDPPAVTCRRREFGPGSLRALAEGDAFACFGPGWEPTCSHVRTPTIPGGPLSLLERVEEFDPRGGPWGRGYLRAATTVRPDDWFFAGHFKNDPCMPGTLMLEGCLSAMAFYLIGLGYSLDRDGWRFEPIPHETYQMVCRGQVVPTSRRLVYELFVEEVHDGPAPKLYADLLCTVDGLKAFHARRMGVQLVPDTPISSRPELLEGDEPGPVATLDGVALGRAAMAHAALGPPSAAFGPRYALFDGARRAPRLPGPPYQLVSRVVKLEGEPWTRRAGVAVEVEYDVPPDAWYFADSGVGQMPFCVLLEAALQPCGWLATYAGCTLDRDLDLRFRNLDGTGRILGAVGPDAGTLRTRAELTRLSDTGSMVIVAFDVRTQAGEREVYRLETVFGFFPDEAFEDQPGLPTDEATAALLTAGPTPGPPPAAPSSSAHLAGGRLRTFDRVPYFDPDGGRAGLGAARAEQDVDRGAWFFRAHFFEDPVQPGSLGLEAMLQLLRHCMLEKGLASSMAHPRFWPIACGPHRWKYRGQVRPSAERTAVTLEIVSIERDDRGVTATAEASLWVDEKRIYEATVGMRVEDRRDGAIAPGRWPRDGRVDPEEIAGAWRRHLGRGPWLGEDVYRALLERFVRSLRVVDPDALDARIGRPALWVANHQSAIETLLLSLIVGAHGGVPAVTVAKEEHRQTWFGRLLRWLASYPRAAGADDGGDPGGGLDPLGLWAHFDRARPEALPELLRGIDADRSILLHAEGTRATVCGRPLGPISAVPVEVAIERRLAVIPVRLAGGLPSSEAVRSESKQDFPVGLAGQDVIVGAPLSPEELAHLPYGARVQRIREALEALAPAEEVPNPPDPALQGMVDRLLARGDGVERPIAVVLAALAASRPSSELGRRLAEAIRGGAPLADGLDPADPRQAWLLELL